MLALEYAKKHPQRGGVRRGCRARWRSTADVNLVLGAVGEGAGAGTHARRGHLVLAARERAALAIGAGDAAALPRASSSRQYKHSRGLIPARLGRVVLASETTGLPVTGKTYALMEADCWRSFESRRPDAEDSRELCRKSRVLVQRKYQHWPRSPCPNHVRWRF